MRGLTPLFGAYVCGREEGKRATLALSKQLCHNPAKWAVGRFQPR
jgi:hypothetical protein